MKGMTDYIGRICLCPVQQLKYLQVSMNVDDKKTCGILLISSFDGVSRSTRSAIRNIIYCRYEMHPFFSRKYINYREFVTAVIIL